MHGGLWLPLVLPLTHKYRFVLPDLRGFGRSHHVPYAHSDVVMNHARDVQDLLAHLGEDRVLLAGLSMGALTALALASLGGFGKVAGYVHIDQAARIHNEGAYTHGLFGKDQPARFAELRGLLEEAEPLRALPFDALPRTFRDRIRSAFVVFLRSAFRPSWLKRAMSSVERERVARMAFPQANWPVYMDCLKAYLDERYDFSGALTDTRIPVTVMVGDASEMYPAQGQIELARSIPGATLVRFANVGHAIPFEAPLGFVRALGRALDSM